MGGFGTEFVVTAVDGGEFADVPLLFVDVSIKVYGVLAFRPVTVIGLLVPFTMMAPGLLVTA